MPLLLYPALPTSHCSLNLYHHQRRLAVTISVIKSTHHFLDLARRPPCAPQRLGSSSSPAHPISHTRIQPRISLPLPLCLTSLAGLCVFSFRCRIGWISLILFPPHSAFRFLYTRPVAAGPVCFCRCRPHRPPVALRFITTPAFYHTRIYSNFYIRILARAPRAPCPSHPTAPVPALSPPATGALRGTRRRAHAGVARSYRIPPTADRCPTLPRALYHVSGGLPLHILLLYGLGVCPCLCRLTGCLEPPRMILWNSLCVRAVPVPPAADVESVPACPRAIARDLPSALPARTSADPAYGLFRSREACIASSSAQQVPRATFELRAKAPARRSRRFLQTHFRHGLSATCAPPD
ncbi:hypothetical protein VTO73DRAFT_6103 [Trametes versicolor]